MIHPEVQLARLGLSLPAPMRRPAGLTLPFSFVNVRGNRAFISGHPKQAEDGSLAGPYGTFGDTFTTQEGYEIARDVALSVLANLKAELGDLSRIAGWSRIFGMVASTPDFKDQHVVVNGFSDLIIQVFGPQIGRHARSALGVVSLPMGFAMEIEAEVLLHD